MTHGLPRWFRLLFTIVMLTLCFVMVSSIIYQQKAIVRIAQNRTDAELNQKLLPRQQRELAQYSADLPEILAELEIAEPAAAEADARVTALKAQRNALRQTVSEQEDIIADLQAQLAELPDPDAVAEQAAATLEEMNQAQSAIQE